MKIALDAMGGDFAPKSIIDGAILALKSFPKDIQIVLLGKEDVIKSHLDQAGVTSDLFSIVHCEEVIEMGEHPTKAISQKPNSSIVVGFGLLKAGKVDAFCSAGNTGAMLVGSLFSIKAIEGVIRPCIAGFIPQQSGKFGVLVDVGANADCKPDVLSQFATLGSLYSQHIFGVADPKVALMNLGEEDTKGTLLTVPAHQMLKLNKNINFIGNVEGSDVFNNKTDVIVTDGFTGNVILKMGEQFHNLVHSRGFQDPFFDMFNYEAVGGSPILGVNGNVMIGHGVSSPRAIQNMLGQARQLVESDI
ncbi:MAG TPA: phosphate acyltransferase PlsX, partial [Cytophagaceae bacterium]|nr:phosphate acyltransferase PlsX [Cytophagaceae bacterium]